MIRILTGIVISIVVLCGLIAAQDTNDDKQSANASSTTEPTVAAPADPATAEGKPVDTPERAKELEAAQERSDELISEGPVPANDKSRATIEQELKRTNAVKIQFKKHQVIIPMVDDVPLSKPADVLMKCFESQPETALGTGKHSLIVSPQPATALKIVKLLANVLYLDGTRKEIVLFPTASLINRGNPDLKLTQPNQETVEKVLGNVKFISIMLGFKNVLVTVSKEADKATLAAAIVELVKNDAKIELLDDPQSLIIKAPVGSLLNILDAVVGTLAANEPDPLADPPKSAADHGEQNSPATPVPFPTGGFGGGGMGGYLMPLPAQAIPSKKYVSTSQIIIAIGEKGDRAWGYSKSLGKWATLKFDKPRPQDYPMVNDLVGCIQQFVTKQDLSEPRKIWAYSGITGTWDKLELPPTTKGVVPILNTDTIIVEHDSLLQIFSAQTGKWSAPPKPEDDADSAVVAKQPETSPNASVANIPSLKVFQLRNMSAEATATLMQQLFRGDDVRLSVDKRTNALISRATDKDQALIEALLVRLDVEPVKIKQDGGTPPAASQAESPEKLKHDYEQADRKATELSQQFAKATNISGEQQAQLRQAVTHAFDLRQQLHRAELATFRARMTKAEQTIQTRDQFKNEIIERRVKDLLNPNLDWDETGTHQPKTVTPSMGATDDKTAQVKITVPADTKVQVLHRKGKRQGDFEVWQDVSDRLNVEYGKTTRLSLSRNRDGRIDKWNASIKPAEPTGETQVYLKHNSVPIVITNEDLDLSPINSMPVVKVVYLPHPKTQELAVKGIETMVSTRVDPSVDVVTEAAKRGSVLITVWLTGNEPESAHWPSRRPTSRRNDGRSIERPPAMPLAEAVAKFNDWLKANPAEGGMLAPLSEDEVIASIRWAATKEKPQQFEKSEFEALLDIAQSRTLPAGWRLTLGTSAREPVTRIPTRASLAYDIWHRRALANQGRNGQRARTRQTGTTGSGIELRYVAVDGWLPGHTIRTQETNLIQPDGKPIDLDSVAPQDAASSGQTLADAVNEFNEHVKVDGQKEPPLTEQEVVAAVFDWKVRRHDAPVSDEEFAKFQQIVEQRRLPPGFKLAVQRRSESRGSFNFDIWCVAILQNWTGQTAEEAIYSYVIRDRFISSRRITDDGSTQKQTAASKPLPQQNTSSTVKEARSTLSNADAEHETVLKMYAIHRALRAYYDQYEHFPPAIVLGRNGKGTMPHSWRVEILPHLGYQHVYDDYHFDEPWDSEHNKTLLTKMPAEFRSPLDRPDSMHASYFGMVTPGLQPALVPSGAPAAATGGTATASPLVSSGAGTFFSNPAGIKIRDVSDGTANTIAFFEAKLPIPWTKPEDVSALIDNPLSKLGGWFPEGWHAGFVYGDVKFIAKDNPEATTRALFTIGSGENVFPKLVEPAGKKN